MTYVMTSSFGGDPETYRRITERVADHADGLVARYAGLTEDGIAVTTVWESKVHSDRFTAEHLVPAVRELVGEPSGPSGVRIDFEAFDVDLRLAR